MSVTDLVARVVDHAGGHDRWDALQALELRVRVGGLAFRMEGQAEPVRDFDAIVAVHEPSVMLRSRAVPEWRGEFDAGTLRLHDPQGAVIEDRPGAVFVRRAPWPRRWDAIDAMAFSGYALWHYATFPALLRRDDVVVSDLGERRGGGESLRGLRLDCPPHLPAHSPSQSLWFADDGTMRRLDYRARMIAPWAVAANRCMAETTAFGVTIPSVRRVTPLLPARRAAPVPLLVSIELELTGVRER